jgi:MoaA/NifB/PqqE/SkfB family radical SAM enzyme
MNIDTLREHTLKNRLPFSASIELTQKCNFSCEHCYCTQGNKELTTKEIIRIIDILYKENIFMLTFTGGEIFTRKDFVDVYLYAKDKGFLVSLMSNLSLLNDKTINILTEYKPREIMISLYGTNDVEYHAFTGKKNIFNKIKSNISALVERKINFILKVPLMENTYNAAIGGRFDDLAKNYDTSIYYDSLIFPKRDLSNKNLIQRLSCDRIVEFESRNQPLSIEWKKSVKNLQMKEQIKCTGGINSLSINSSGNVNICTLFQVDNIPILENKFAIIWNNLKKNTQSFAILL